MQDYGFVSIITPTWRVQTVYKLVYGSVYKR
mgnify:FL=1